MDLGGEMFYSSKDKLTVDDIDGFINKHRKECIKYNRLERYYKGKHDIVLNELYRSDNRHFAVHPYCTYITNMLTGYFMGQPVKYTAVNKDTEEDDELLSILSDIFRFNDEQSENLELAKTNSIKGIAPEILWRDKDNRIRFKNLQPDEAFGIYDMTLEGDLKFAIRYYVVLEDDKEIMYIELYDKNYKHLYRKDEKTVFVNSANHYFRDIPFVFYENNEEVMGDFEGIIPLIDAYDIAQTNTLIDMQDFTDAFLVLVNYTDTSEEALKQARKEKTILIDDDGDAKWLTKPVDNKWVEDYKNRLNHDIHKFSYTPDMTDENFGSNLSGVSLRYKLLAMEQIRSVKERRFKRGLMRRIKLICNALSYTTKEYDFTGIGIDFNNTLPQNLLEVSQIITNLSPYMSKESLLSMLPDVENAKEEIEKKKVEEEEDIDIYTAFTNKVKEGENLDEEV